MTPEERAKNRTSDSWITQAGSPKTQTGRKAVINAWALANNTNPQPLHEQIRAGNIDPIEAANKFVKHLISTGYAPNTIAEYRRKIFQFYRYAKCQVDKDDFNIEVAKGIKPRKLTPTITVPDEKIREMLIKATPRGKALLSLILHGLRIEEATILHVTNLNLNSKPPNATIEALYNKTGEERTIPITTEANQLMTDYLKNRDVKSEWLFPGRPSTEPADKSASYKLIQDLFKRAGLTEKRGKYNIYHPHIFRTFYINRLKQYGMPDIWAETLAGHDTGVASHYKPPYEQIAQKWLEIQDHFCFIEPATQKKQHELENRLSEVEQRITKEIALRTGYSNKQILQIGQEILQKLPTEIQQRFEKGDTTDNDKLIFVQTTIQTLMPTLLPQLIQKHNKKQN